MVYDSDCGLLCLALFVAITRRSYGLFVCHELNLVLVSLVVVSLVVISLVVISLVVISCLDLNTINEGNNFIFHRHDGKLGPVRRL
jgi:hypothetical protein